MNFNYPIIVPVDYRSFNDSVVKLRIYTSKGKLDKNLQYSWIISDFSSQQMVIKLKFKDPDIVSKGVRFS